VTRDADDPAEVFSITAAAGSHSEDLDRRINRYLISMLIRTACVILVFVVSGPLRWVFAAGAVFLPYVAVVLANATGRPRGTGPAPVQHRGLSAGSGARPGAGARAGSAPVSDAGGDDRVVLEGRIVTGPGSSTAPDPPPSRHAGEPAA